MSVRRSLIPIVLLVVATVAALNCGDPSPLGVAVPPPVATASVKHHADGDDGDDTDENEDSLVSCRPLPYETVTQTIGPEGGVLEVRRNWLVVPRGALKDKVSITAVAPSDTLALIRFQPEGLRFQKTAFLVVAYDNCRVKRGVTPRIAHVTDGLDVIDFLPTVAASPHDPRLKKVHKGHQRVVGELQHFSNYAVAW
jgi:hypothetical protein